MGHLRGWFLRWVFLALAVGNVTASVNSSFSWSFSSEPAQVSGGGSGSVTSSGVYLIFTTNSTEPSGASAGVKVNGVDAGVLSGYSGGQYSYYATGGVGMYTFTASFYVWGVECSGSSLGSFYWDGSEWGGSGPPTDGTLNVALTVTNNVNRAQTVTVGNAAPQNLGPLTSVTLNFVCTGTAGSFVDAGSSPDVLTFTGSPDPMLIPAAGTTSSVTRTANIGEAAWAKQLHVTLCNYGEAQNVRVLLDGAFIGTMAALAGSDAAPGLSQYDYTLNLSGSSNLTFQAANGAPLSADGTKGPLQWSFVVYVQGSGSGYASSVTQDPESGTTTATTTAIP